MFNSLRGTITTVGPGYLRLETAGVEWELEASAETVNHYQAGDPDARVLVFLYHREDTMKLFGFATEAERRMFLELTKVDGVGPRQAPTDDGRRRRLGGHLRQQGDVAGVVADGVVDDFEKPDAVAELVVAAVVEG